MSFIHIKSNPLFKINDNFLSAVILQSYLEFLPPSISHSIMNISFKIGSLMLMYNYKGFKC